MSSWRQSIRTRITRNSPGFTIVELLIVIVVIGILAAIVIVAFAGMTNRATFSAIQNDLQSINKALNTYNALKGEYPITGTTAAPGWRYSCETGIASFIPDITAVVQALPQAPCKNSSDRSDTWIYASDGVGYKLLHIRPNESIASYVPDANRDTRYSTSNPTWGYWTTDWASQ